MGGRIGFAQEGTTCSSNKSQGFDHRLGGTSPRLWAFVLQQSQSSGSFRQMHLWADTASLAAPPQSSPFPAREGLHPQRVQPSEICQQMTASSSIMSSVNVAGNFQQGVLHFFFAQSNILFACECPSTYGVVDCFATHHEKYQILCTASYRRSSILSIGSFALDFHE